MDFKELVRTKVNLVYQLFLIFFDLGSFVFLLIVRSRFFNTREKVPELHPITPQSFKKFGGIAHKIRTGLYINELIDFNMITNTFMFDGAIWFSFDPGAISLDTLEKFSFEKGEIIQQSPPNTKLISGKLHVRYNLRVRFKSSLNYKDFPLDDHKIFIVCINRFISPGEVIFESSRQDFVVKADVGHVGWKLVDRSVQFGYLESKLGTNQKERADYPGIMFELDYARNSIRYALSIVLPLALIFYLVLFSVSLRLISAIGITAAGVTAILAYRFVIESMSPKTGYFMLSDYLFFLFLSATLSVFVINVAEAHMQATPWMKGLILLSLHITILALVIIFFFFTKKIRRKIVTALWTGNQKVSQEFPQNENKNWIYPDFLWLYFRLKPTLYGQFFRKKNTLGYRLKQLLETVTEHRKKEIRPGKVIEKLKCAEGSHIYIWGDLYGAYHSLTRALTWLKEKKIINDALEILQPNTYFVFNGNVINRGPYNMETLHAILQLMEKNPEKVIYLKGTQERLKNWTNHQFKEELQIRAGFVSDEVIPLESLITNFFDTLPLALYISLSNEPEYIRISPSGRNDVEIKESSVATLFKSGQEKALQHYMLNEAKASKDEVPALNILSIIKGEDLQKEMRAKKGIGLLDQDRGATAWSIFSSPVEAHQTLFNFQHDAFALVTIGNPLAQSEITVYSRIATGKESFVEAARFNMITGSPLDAEEKVTVPQKSIHIGSSMALQVEGVPIMGQRTKRGMAARINKENRAGGVNGLLLQATIYNDDYTPVITRNNITHLIEKDKTDIILLPVGSPTLASYLDFIKEKKVVALFPITGAPQFRDPELKGVLHFRGTYEDEVRALIDHMVKNASIRKFAFFYQDDAYGLGPLEAAHEQLKKMGVTDWVDIPYQRNSIEFKEQAQKIKESQPDAIGFFATAQASDELIREVGVAHLTNKQLFAISFVGEQTFREFIKRHGLNVIFGAVVPNPRTSLLEIVKEYRKEMDRNNDPYDVFSLEGYIATSILIDAISKIEPPVTKEKILQHLESYKDYQFKDLTLTFDPKRRDLARYVWLEHGEGQEWVQKDIVKSEPKKKDDNARSTHSSGSK